MCWVLSAIYERWVARRAHCGLAGAQSRRPRRRGGALRGRPGGRSHAPRKGVPLKRHPGALGASGVLRVVPKSTLRELQDTARKMDKLDLDDYRTTGAFIAKRAKLEGGVNKLEAVLNCCRSISSSPLRVGRRPVEMRTTSCRRPESSHQTTRPIPFPKLLFPNPPIHNFFSKLRDRIQKRLSPGTSSRSHRSYARRAIGAVGSGACSRCIPMGWAWEDR